MKGVPATLGDICTLNYGKSLPEKSRSGHGLPVMGSGGVVGHHDRALVEGHVVVVGRKGSYGHVHRVTGGCWPIDTTYFVDERSADVDLDWLYRLLRYLPLTSMNRSAAVPGLSREDAYRLPIFVPYRSIQQRIAAILDAADDLRAKRREALAKVDTLMASFFQRAIEDIGAVERVPIGSLTDGTKGAIRTGPFGSQLLHSEFTTDGIAVLGIDNAVNNEFRWGERRFISREKYEELKRFTVRPGDVLITIMGTCGRVAVVPDDIPQAINTKHLCCITLDRSRCLPEWLWASLRFESSVRRQLGATHGAIMSGLNMGKIKDASVPLPPVGVQAQVVGRLEAVRRMSRQGQRSGRELDTLFASLQQRAFGGEL